MPTLLDTCTFDDASITEFKGQQVGYIYIVVDSNYPELFKLGYTTSMPARLKSYNENRPFKTVRVKVISCLFKRIQIVEKAILTELRLLHPQPYDSYEWFPVTLKQRAIELITEAESHFDRA